MTNVCGRLYSLVPVSESKQDYRTKNWEMKRFLVLAVLQVLCIGQSVQDANKLKVSIYYESLCSYSADFITKQFYPAYLKLKSALQVDLVPYGNAKLENVNGTWVFECQHGEDECWGNKAQACGLAADKGQDKSVEYVNCMMEQDDPTTDDAVQKCAPKLGIPATSILECAGSVVGDQLHAVYGLQTNAVEQVAQVGVPLIIFNDVFDELRDITATTGFLETCCSLLGGDTEGCPSEDNKLEE